MVYFVTQDIFYIPLHFQLLQLIGLTKRWSIFNKNKTELFD